MQLHVTLAVLTAMVVVWYQPAAAQQHPNLDAQAILAQQARIRADAIAGTGPYKDLSEHQRSQLFALQDRVTAKLSGRVATTAMDEHDQIAVFNALEAISAILNGDEDERMICERKRPVGSNRRETVCRTVAQRRADHESADAYIHARNHRPVVESY